MAENSREMLVKLLGRLGSDNDNERAVAGRVAWEMIRKLNLSWDDVIVPALGERAKPKPKIDFNQTSGSGGQPGEKLTDWFRSPEDFEEMLGAAMERSNAVNEATFLDSLSEKFGRFGARMYLSERQYNWLSDIADRG
jgi:hypothetical protein